MKAKKFGRKLVLKKETIADSNILQTKDGSKEIACFNIYRQLGQFHLK